MGDMVTPSVNELRRVLQTRKPGDKLVIEVQRDREKLTLTIEVGTLPQVAKE